MSKLTQKGFTIIEGALIGVIILALGGIGWFVYTKSQTQDETSQPQSSATVATDNSEAEQDPAKEDETSDWEEIESADSAVSVRYPDSLYAKQCESRDGTPYVGLSPKKDDGYKTCGNYEMPGYITFKVFKKVADYNGDCKVIGTDSESTRTATETTINGKKVCKFVATRTVDADEAVDYTWAAFDKTITYEYIENGKVYYANYTHYDGYSDMEKVFDEMYAKTLEFN